MERVVVTAYGVVSPIGASVSDFKENLFSGKSGVIGIRGTLVPDNFPVPYAAVVKDSLLKERQYASKFWNFTAQALEEALSQLGPIKNEESKSIFDGMIYGTSEGVSYDLVQESFTNLEIDERQLRSETSLDIMNSIIERRGLGSIPPEHRIGVNIACASGNQAIGLAFHRIRSGKWKRALAGGVDARCNPSNLMNFYMLSALATMDVAPETASRPFSLSRDGFVRGEGAAILVLESLTEARARGAIILGEVTGYANTSDAYRLTDGREDGEAVVKSMHSAVRDAGLELDQIDYINAHGTSTPLNDRLETLAIKKLFGQRAYDVPVSSFKSQVGHSTVAAGALEAVACLLMLQEQKVAPTLNYHDADPECDLDYVPNVAREAKVTHVLSNNFGFGGQNACLVLSRYE